MNHYNGEVPSFSILDVLRGMAHRKVLMLSSLALGALLGTGMVVAIKPKYQAEARVLIDNFATPYDSANVPVATQREPAIDERTITSQVAVLGSEDIGKRVISALKLTERAEFDSMKSGIGLVGQLKIATGFADDPRLMTPEQRAYDQLSGALTVYPVPLSNVIAIKYVSRDGETAASVANALAETYVLATKEAGTGDTDRSRRWLSSQIEELRQKVVESDAAVEKFRADAGLIKGALTTLGTQEISELNSQITLAEAARSEAEAKAAEIREMLETRGTVESASDVMNSVTVQRLREQQVAAEGRLTALSATYLPNHPRMVAAQKEVNDLERRIRREALKVVDGLQGQAKIAAARAASLRQSLDSLKDRQGSSLQEEVRLKELEREAKANRDQLEIMLARFADTNTRQNLDLQPGFARIIQTASVPAAPFFPRSGPIILLASLAGIALGAGLAFLLEIMAQASRIASIGTEGQATPYRNRHPARSAVEHNLDIPQLDLGQPREPEPAPAVAPAAPVQPVAAPLMTLASIPQARSGLEATALLASLASGGSNHATLGQLSLHLQAMRSKGNLRACANASLGGGSEVPAVSLALGRNLADNGLKTILVDLEPHRSLLPDLLGLPYAPGLVELIAGKADFGRAIQRDTQSSLQFIRYGAADAGSEAMLLARMEAITKTLSGIYDVVLLHGGEASPASLKLLKGCDTVLLHTPPHRRADATAAAGTLKANGFANVFLVQVEGPQQAAA